jgi:tetratricopeptide (TPR) repeat protein
MRSVLLVVVCASACAPKTAPPPAAAAAPVVVLTPHAVDDFLRPELPAAFAGTAAARGYERGWSLLQSGDLKGAERELSAVLGALPEFYPAEVSLGYVELARKDAPAALTYFDRALRWRASDRSALLGRGQALLSIGRERDALHTFEAAVAADPSLTEVARRIEVLRFRLQEQTLARAREASRTARWEDAVAAYTEAIEESPDSPFLYRELGEAERRMGNTTGALQHVRRAAALDPKDAGALATIGEILESEGDAEGASKAYRDALALEPRADLEERIQTLRTRTETVRLPDEYKAIESAAAITRADLAALVGIRLGSLLGAATSRAVLVTDLRSTWAAPWIVSVTRAGVMEPFANHAFQPRAVVRRIEFAQTASRLLMLVAARGTGQRRLWESARLRFPDLAPSHLAYIAASQTVASGVMRTEADGAFQPARPIGGRDAVDAVTRLEALADASASRDAR